LRDLRLVGKRETTTYLREGTMIEMGREQSAKLWAAAGFKDTLLRWSMKQEIANGNEKAIQPGVQG
jgi:hypothetical protein